MKHLITLLITLAIATTVHAKQIPINASHLVDNAYTFPLTMPCDWDGDLGSTTIFGYYGESKAQFLVEPISLGKFGPSGLLIELSPDIAQRDGQELSQIVIEYPEKGGRCTKTSNPYDSMTK